MSNFYPQVGFWFSPTSCVTRNLVKPQDCVQVILSGHEGLELQYEIKENKLNGEFREYTLAKNFIKTHDIVDDIYLGTSSRWCLNTDHLEASCENLKIGTQIKVTFSMEDSKTQNKKITTSCTYTIKERKNNQTLDMDVELGESYVEVNGKRRKFLTELWLERIPADPTSSKPRTRIGVAINSIVAIVGEAVEFKMQNSIINQHEKKQDDDSSDSDDQYNKPSPEQFCGRKD